MQVPTLQSRYRGAMLGTLIGDALGAPYEWKRADLVEADIKARTKDGPYSYQPFDYLDPWSERRGKPPLPIRAGQPTDDSELAAALAVSLIEIGGLNAQVLFGHLRSFIIDRKSILTDKAYGLGGTLRAALSPETYEDSVALFEQGKIQTPPSNGSLMRCAPIPLVFKGLPRSLIARKAAEQSAVTHRNPESIAACMLFSIYVEEVLWGRSCAEAWERSKILLRDLKKPGCESVLAIEPTKPDYESEMKSIEGYAVLSLRVAAWASVTADSFADGIIKAISVGGDTDTYGAIAGGILGARFGLESIPLHWQDAMQGKGKMLELADGLYMLLRH